MNEPVYKYEKGQGWVPKMNPTPCGEVSPSGRYVVMFKVSGMHGWRNAKRLREWLPLDKVKIYYQQCLSNYATDIKEHGWEFEIWPVEQEVDE